MAARGKQRKPAKSPSKKRAKPVSKSKRGGKRDGAGRPRDRLPEDVITRLGPPPQTAKELRTWNARLLAEVQWLSLKGEIGTELAASIRANAGSLDRALPETPATPTSGSGDDDDDDDEEDGPELEANAATAPADGLRVG